jgi:hypothetical protein
MRDAGDTGRKRADTPTNPSRRGLMAGSTAALLAGVTAAHGNASHDAKFFAGLGDDAALLALCAEFHKQDAVVGTLEWGENEPLSAALDVRWSLSNRIKSIPPTTLAGMRAKAAVGLRLLDENRGPDHDDGDADAAFAYAVLRDIATETPEIGS